MLVVRGEETLDAELHYFYNYLPLHFAEASERDKLANLLLDPAWLQAKLAVTSSPQNLVADYNQYGRSSIHVLIGQTLRLTSGICMRNQSQLLPQLLGRISRDAAPQAAAFLDKVRQLIQQPAILKQHHSLTPPESDASRIAGHSGWIRALTLLPDGKLASCSSDNTILLWDLDSGLESLRLAGHVGEVMALAQLPDNHLASGSSDDTIRLWDLASGAEIGRLENRSGGIRALAALPGGLLAAGWLFRQCD